MAIPRLIHQFWVGPPMPEAYRRFAAGWRRLHPGWEYRLWSEAGLPKLHNQALYEQAGELCRSHFVHQLRSDIVRYELLARYGGVWVDTDCEPRKPLDGLLEGVACFAAWEIQGRVVGNSILGCQARHPFIAELVADLERSVRDGVGRPPSKTSGPHYVTAHYRRWPQMLTVFDQRLFYPYGCRELEAGERDWPDAYMIHHWNHQRTLRGRPLWHAETRRPRAKTVRLSAAMMAHRRRRTLVRRIRERLDRPVKVVWDRANDRWDTGRRAMLAYDPEATHHCVIQDDVLVCRDLLAGLEKALRYVPDDVPVCGYVGRVRPFAAVVRAAALRADSTGASWLRMPTLNWGPLVVVPTALIPEMIDYCDKLADVPNYDRRLSRYFESRRVRTYYTWPSLVDHADGPSLVPGRLATDRAAGQVARIAHRFLGEAASALDVDWSGPVIDIEESGSSAGQVVLRNTHTGQELHLQPSSPRLRRLAGVAGWEIVPAGVMP